MSMKSNTPQLPPGGERRIASIELRRSSSGPTIVGHAAVFNSPSLDLGGFREIIEPGAFADAIGSSDIRSLFNHDQNIVLGRMSAGTLLVSEDVVGLLTETTPPDTQLVRDMVLEPMRRGDVTQMSFAFRVHPDGAKTEETDDGFVRTILKGGVAELFDTSVVTYPAYPDTDVAVRSIKHLTGAAKRRLARIAYMQRDNRISEMHADIYGQQFPGPEARQRVIARMNADLGCPRTVCKPYRSQWPRRLSV